MRGKAGDLSRLFHIVKWCRKLGRIHASIQTYEEFIAKKNYEKVDLSAFYIGQIGELVRNLSDDMKTTLADIPWRQINAMRNILVHNYGKSRKETIWNVIAKDAPALAERCLEVLRAENSNVDAELREELEEETGIIFEEQPK